MTLGYSFTLPTVTNITGVTVTGSVDSATAGNYDVTWSKVVSGVTRRFVVAQPFRYLVVWGGDFGSERGIFYEMELSLLTPLGSYNNIKFGEALPVSDPVETKQWTYFSTFNKYETVFDGQKGPASNGTDNLQFTTLPTNGAVMFYMDMGSTTLAYVSSGSYWTNSSGLYVIGSGKLYGTNTNPSTFTEAQRIDPATYTFICDLTKK
jgi:hypothetical protein